MSKDIYIVYETTNLINGKFYIGVHKQKNLKADNYLGSGKLLKQAILKYGKENFTRYIINSFKYKEDAYKLEEIIVNDNLTNNYNCYNINRGGKIPPPLYGNKYRLGILHSQEIKDKISKNNARYWKGKTRSLETRIKMSNSKKGMNNKNSLYNLELTRKKRSVMCIINGKLFKSIREAGRVIGVDPKTIWYWIKYNIPLYYSI